MIISSAYCIRRFYDQKIGGDRGQPCLVPLVIVKEKQRNLEVYTLAEGAVYSEVIALNIEPPNPNFKRTWERYVQLTLLMAFSATKDNRTKLAVSA